MLRLLADENIKRALYRSLAGHRPALDIVRVQEAGLSGQADEAVLAWAATEGRVLLTRDCASVSDPAYARVAAGLPMPGVLVIRREFGLGPVIAEVLLIAEASEPDEWKDRVVWIPLNS